MRPGKCNLAVHGISGREGLSEGRSAMFGWGVKTISADELADRLAAAHPVVIDVREPLRIRRGPRTEAPSTSLWGRSASTSANSIRMPRRS